MVLPLDLTAGGSAEGLRNGDQIYVPRLRPTLDSAVQLQGHVFTAGAYFYRPGMRLTDVIDSVDDLQPNADLHYVLIRRELPPDRHVEAISANIAAALAAPGSPADVTLMPRDQITVFDLSSSRDRIVHPILEDLRMEATAEQPEQVVTVEGRVNVSGQYPLEPGMTVADLIRAGGGLADAAYAGKAELTRYVVVDGSTRRTDIIDIDVASALSGNPAANVTLDPYDVLSVKEVSQWANQESITLKGEVRFPGTYTIQPGETLKSVIERAGGLTQFAFPQGSVFTRTELKVREQQQMDLLASRMKIELGVLALRAVATAQGGNVGNSESALVVGRSLLSQLQGEKAVGRLVINLPGIMREPAESSYDVVLRDGDELIVPKFEQEVTVIGEVQDATSHLYNSRPFAGRLHRVERRIHGSGRSEEGLCRPRRWQRGCKREQQPLVQSRRKRRDRAWRYDRGADQRHADAAVAVLGGHDGYRLQRGDCGGGDTWAVVTISGIMADDQVVKRALITGITGQDGAYLAELLLNKGYEVHGIKRRASSFNTDRIDHLYQDPHERDVQLHLHYGDLTDATNLIRIVQQVQPDEIYNLAAQSHVAVSFETPEYTANSDALGALRLLEAIRILGLEKRTRFYQASTSEMFGKVQETPQRETTPSTRARPMAPRRCTRTGLR